jgi:hypothetical protein
MGLTSPDPVLSALCPQLNLLNPPKKIPGVTPSPKKITEYVTALKNFPPPLKPEFLLSPTQEFPFPSCLESDRSGLHNPASFFKTRTNACTLHLYLAL